MPPDAARMGRPHPIRTLSGTSLTFSCSESGQSRDLVDVEAVPGDLRVGGVQCDLGPERNTGRVPDRCLLYALGFLVF
jgi:hypothetical protein